MLILHIKRNLKPILFYIKALFVSSPHCILPIKLIPSSGPTTERARGGPEERGRRCMAQDSSGTVKSKANTGRPHQVASLVCVSAHLHTFGCSRGCELFPPLLCFLVKAILANAVNFSLGIRAVGEALR